jgi:hypothetical protein
VTEALQRFDSRDDAVDRLLRVAEERDGFGVVEERVVDACEAETGTCRADKMLQCMGVSRNSPRKAYSGRCNISVSASGGKSANTLD